MNNIIVEACVALLFQNGSTLFTLSYHSYIFLFFSPNKKSAENTFLLLQEIIHSKKEAFSYTPKFPGILYC